MRGLVLGALSAVLSVSAFAKNESKTPAELAATQGFVRVSVPQWAFGNPPTLHVRGGKDSYKLVRVVEDGPYAYGAWVPAGQYDIEGMVAADGSPYTPLIVESARMTDLGAVLRIQLGGYETVLLPIRHPEADAETRAAHSRLGSILRSGDDIRWAPSAPPKSVRNPQPASGLGLIADLISDYERSVNKPRLSKQLKEAPTLDALAALARLAVAPATEESATDSARNLYFGADFGRTSGPSSGRYLGIDRHRNAGRGHCGRSCGGSYRRWHIARLAAHESGSGWELESCPLVESRRDRCGHRSRR